MLVATAAAAGNVSLSLFLFHPFPCISSLSSSSFVGLFVAYAFRFSASPTTSFRVRYELVNYGVWYSLYTHLQPLPNYAPVRYTAYSGAY